MPGQHESLFIAAILHGVTLTNRSHIFPTELKEITADEKKRGKYSDIQTHPTGTETVSGLKKFLSILPWMDQDMKITI
jgi:hypothetical protein